MKTVVHPKKNASAHWDEKENEVEAGWNVDNQKIRPFPFEIQYNLPYPKKPLASSKLSIRIEFESQNFTIS